MTKFGDVLTTDEVPSSGTTILNGTGPPADALGAVGNYYLDTAAKILYGPKSTYGPDQTPVTGTPASSSVGVSFPTLGIKIRTLAAGRIPALRYYRMSGIASAHSVTLQLWLESTQAEVGKVVVSNAANSPGGWVKADLSSPVTVPAGATAYRVSVCFSSAVSNGWTGAVPTSSIPALVPIDGICYSPASNTYPGTDLGTYYFADIVFQVPTGLWPVALKSAP